MSHTDRILATKLLAPRTGVKLIERRRLLERFETYRARKLTLVSAPAGYGKTVLISQFTASVQASVVWYQLDRFDNDLALFIQHLLAGVDRHIPGFSNEIVALMERSGDVEKDIHRITTALVNSLAVGLQNELVLVIDDYHTIEEEAVHVFMEQFLDYLPANVHLILASRTTPPLHLGRLKVAGLMDEINLEDLRFTSDEIAGFLSAERNEPVSGETITYLEAETDGWPAALRLAGISLAGMKTRQWTSGGRGLNYKKDIYHYLATEVLTNLPEDLANFVLTTSVFEIMTPQICDAFLERSDSANVLESLESQNLFTIAMEGDSGIYRYHHLFREFLISRLGEKRANLSQKAGQCYLQAGYPARAVECFLSVNDYSQAMVAIEQVAAPLDCAL